MKHTHPRIVFMGTPEFAVPSLEALVQAGFPVVGVVTAPDKPAGRGQQLQASAVKQAALRLGIQVFQPEKLRSPEFLEQLKSLQADLQIVVAFRMLPEVIWSAPPMGTFNLHASLLPQYRGAAPINWAIIQGERFTGITTFFLRQDIDTGNILLQEKVEIGTDETVGSLYARLMHAGAGLVVRTVQGLMDKSITPRPQADTSLDGSPFKPAPKLNKENTRLSTALPVASQFNFVRGLSPYPAAHGEFFRLSDQRSIPVKLFQVRASPDDKSHLSGKLLVQDKEKLFIEGPDGLLEILELQPAGKGRMKARDFLNGNRLEGEWTFR